MAPVAISPIEAPYGPASSDTIKMCKATLHDSNVMGHTTTPASYTPTPLPSHSKMACNTLGDVELERPVILDGYTMSTADVVRVARYDAQLEIGSDPIIEERVRASTEYLKSKLHLSLYGISTGFGGSADTRTKELEALQVSLLEHQLTGVLPQDLIGRDGCPAGPRTIHDPLKNAMPEAIVRGAIAIRINSLVRGHSGVRWEVLQALNALLTKRLTPVVPLRGSISASGDLQPLAYVAATICGHPDILVMDRSSPHAFSILPAPEALAKHGIERVVLGAKEGLGLINGTAFSASAGALAAHDAHGLALLTQALTAMSVEALMGQAGNFHEFISKIRPHPGQIEASANMLKLLDGSRLAVHKEEERTVDSELDENVLRQDRYPLRTSPQWLGPQLEDLLAVQETLSCEINSTTDNPLLDIEGDHVHHGGNFQAVAVGQAMEKTRLALYMMGKLAFAQTVEIINVSMNKGLPSCLAGDEPSLNYHAKGIDLNMAAYTAELGYLANPVSTHVQSAEQHNQAVNSMALVSARYTIEATEVLSMLLSAQLYCVCQAIDLRVMDLFFRERFANSIPSLLSTYFSEFLPSPAAVDSLSTLVLMSIYRRLESTANMDSQYRFVDAFNVASSVLTDALAPYDGPGNPLKALAKFKQDAAQKTADLYRSTRDEYYREGMSAGEYMGQGRALYDFVRRTLGIKVRRGDVGSGGVYGSAIGSDVGKINASIRSGELYAVLRTLFAKSEATK